MKKNITAFVGHDFGGREWTSREVMKATIKALNREGIEYATFSECVGCWRDGFETSTRVELLEVDTAKARKALEAVAVELMQWEIIYTVNGSDTFHIMNDPTEARASHVAA